MLVRLRGDATATPSDFGLVGAGFVAAGFVAAGLVAAALPAPFSSAPFAFERVRFGGEPSELSAAARRPPFRAGRAAGTISAGRSARVREATIVRKV